MKRSFVCLVITQIQVLLNDNAAKLMLMALGAAVAPDFFREHDQGLPPDQQAAAEDFGKLLKTILATIIILPFVLFAPTAGWVADRFSKRQVIVWTLWAQMFVMGLITLAVHLHTIELAIVGLFLLGVQCAFFSPAKQGIIKEIVAPNTIGTAVGIVEVTAITSMLVGGLAGGTLYDYCRLQTHDRPWFSAQITLMVLAGMALLSLVAGYQIKVTPARSNQPFRASLLWEHFGQLREVYQEKAIRFSVFGISYFYGFAGALYLTLFEVSGEVYNNQTGTASQTGVYASVLGFGIICGSFLVTRLTTHQVEIGLVPFGALGMIAATLGAGMAPPTGFLFLMALFLLGAAGALFVVPLNAYLQEQVEPDRRGRILSANNLIVNLFGIGAVLIQFFISLVLHVKAQNQLFLYAIPTTILALFMFVSLPEGLLRLFLALLGRTFYRVQPMGLDRVPEQGGVVLLPNHISFIDAIVLQLACPRPIRFVVDEGMYQLWYLNWGLRMLDAIPVNAKRARGAIETAAEALARGEVVCLFPEGALTRTSALQKLNRGYELVARKARVPIVPVWLENVWGSVFSFYGGKFFWKRPREFPLRVWIYFGEPVDWNEASPETMRRRLYDLSAQAFESRPELKSHIGREAIRGLKRHFFKPVITDGFANDRTLTGGKLLAIGMALGRKLRNEVTDKRVGIILPPGLGVTIANLAVVLAGKTPVNLNFTAGRAANEAAIKKAHLRVFLSSAPMVARVKDFPWPTAESGGEMLDVADLVKGVSKLTLLTCYVLGWLGPVYWLGRWMEVPEEGDRDEAVLLFTSGSAGEPKGVMMSHRNIIANTAQIEAVLARTHIQSVLGCLPIFHSFGSTVTLWWPLMGGPRVVTYPSPLETSKLSELIERQKVELMINTPTFLRAFIRKSRPEQLKSLKMVVTGAEKLPIDLMKEFEATLHVGICEGYGMTEASPVVAVNAPDIPPTQLNPSGMSCRRPGSVGRMLPGISARIRHPETEEDLSLFETGVLWLKGANVFGGYYKDKKRTDDILKDDWYCTGDVGRFDEDGFLFVEGRISRFSKIAGEMVPHGTVEQRVIEAFPEVKSGETVPLVVMGVPDRDKGERLVLLTTQAIDCVELRTRLIALGLPVLWVPRTIQIVQAIPLLATGKLDLAACQNLALEFAKDV